MTQHAEKLGASILRRIVCVTSSEHLYFNGKPKTDLKTILTTVGIEIPSEFPIALSNFLKDKTHIHFDFKTPASDMSTIQRLMQGSHALTPSFSSFPESKQENTIPNTIFNTSLNVARGRRATAFCRERWWWRVFEPYLLWGRRFCHRHL